MKNRIHLIIGILLVAGIVQSSFINAMESCLTLGFSDQSPSYGDEDAAPLYQMMTKKAVYIMGLKEKIQVKKMNEKTKKANGFGSIFIVPRLKTIWINAELCSQMPDFIKQYNFFHEIAHLVLHHHEKRAFEFYSGTFIGLVGCANIVAARLPVFSLPAKFRFMQVGLTSTVTALSKTGLDQTLSYQSLRQKWYKSQENEAHRMALSVHDNPKDVLNYYTEVKKEALQSK